MKRIKIRKTQNVASHISKQTGVEQRSQQCSKSIFQNRVFRKHLFLRGHYFAHSELRSAKQGEGKTFSTKGTKNGVFLTTNNVSLTFTKIIVIIFGMFVKKRGGKV